MSAARDGGDFVSSVLTGAGGSGSVFGVIWIVVGAVGVATSGGGATTRWGLGAFSTIFCVGSAIGSGGGGSSGRRLTTSGGAGSGLTICMFKCCKA